MRIDRQRAAERFERELLLTEFLHDNAETRERAEMARLARQHLTDVGKRLAVVLVGEMQRGAPVPCLDIVGPQLEYGIEQLDREAIVLAVDRGLDPAHQKIGSIAAGREPERPDATLDQLG